ncbi:hypothetical protein [Rickettsia sp. R1]
MTVPPEPLDMYRGIKKIQEKIPGALDKNCLILIQNKEPEPLKNFVAKMEEKVQGTGGKTRYEQLRENRISKIKEYQAKLKNVSKKTAVTQAATIGKDLKDTLLKRKQDNKKATGDLAANARRAKRANFIG